jgi:hypothetical protein
MRIHTETSEKTKGGKSVRRESNDRYENEKEDYATCKNCLKKSTLTSLIRVL